MQDDALRELLRDYLRTGGFPRSIMDMVKYGRVTGETEKTHLDWLKGDWAKAGRSDAAMKEVLAYLVRAQGTPVSWNSIAGQTSIGSPHTTQSYVETLVGQYALVSLNFIAQDSRIEHRKNRKLHFADSLTCCAAAAYVREKAVDSWLLESTVAAHLARAYPVYYWRNHTEVDVVCVHKRKQIGFEVTKGIKKWNPPCHIKKWHLLDRSNVHRYLAALG